MAITSDIDPIAQDQNRWWDHANYINLPRFINRRDAFDDVWKYVDGTTDTRAAVLIGPRQVGKTTVLLQIADQLLAKGFPPGNLLYFDFSDDRLAHPLSPRAVVDLQPPGRVATSPRIFLLDEIQEAVNWQRWLKGAVDAARRSETDVRPIFVVTGSSAGALHDGGIESGHGRWDEIDIEGLTYGEFLRLSAREGEDLQDVLGREPGAFNRYLSMGGFPEHVLLEDRQDPYLRIRQDVVERAILRDLRRSGVDLDRVKRLFQYLVTGSGDIWNAEERAKDLEGTNPKSVKEWLSLLEQTHLVRRLDRELPIRSKASTKLRRPQPKIYVADHGLIAAFSRWADPIADGETRGRILEAAVFRHLRAVVPESDGTLGYFRRDDNLEVDFVVRPKGRAAVTIEVTASSSIDKWKIERLAAASKMAGAERQILIHSGLTRRTDGTLEIVPARQFMLAPRTILEVTK